MLEKGKHKGCARKQKCKLKPLKSWKQSLDSRAQHGAWCLLLLEPWADVGNRETQKLSWLLHTLSYSWSQRAPGDRSFGKKEEAIKMLKEQPV